MNILTQGKWPIVKDKSQISLYMREKAAKKFIFICLLLKNKDCYGKNIQDPKYDINREFTI